MPATIPRDPASSPDRMDQLLRAAVPEIAYEFWRVNTATQGNLTGERRLLLALLLDAVELIQGKRGLAWDSKNRRSDPKIEARRWITGQCSRGQYFPLAFEDVCMALNLDPEAVRAAELDDFPRHPPRNLR